jgi:hypothetical protein
MGRVLSGLTALSHALAMAFGSALGIAVTVGLSGIALCVLLFRLPAGIAACSMPVAVGGAICVTARQTVRRGPGHSPPGLRYVCNKVKSER